MSEEPELNFNEPRGDIVTGVQRAIKNAKNGGALTSDHLCVLELLISLWAERTAISQRDIAKAEPRLGCTRHDIDFVADPNDSTLRKVRLIIRELRVTHKVPVLSSTKGYFLPSTLQEATEYMDTKEREAKARAKSSMETYYSMKTTLGISSRFFDSIEADDEP
jgi:hypothetical protein